VSFVKRLITVTLQLGSGDFGENTGDTVTMEGLRCSVQITKAGGRAADTANIRVWGVTPDIMNKATRTGKPLTYPRNNIVTVAVGDADKGMSVVFSGMVQSAYGEFSDPPNASLNIVSISNAVALAAPVKPQTFPNGADIVVVMEQIAASMGKNLVNWGVSGIQLPTAYFSGTAIQQMHKAADAAGINPYTTDGNPLEIWPKNGTRGGSVPLISPATGLVGYPAYCDVGIQIRTLYMPGLNYGAQFTLDTSITNAKGPWNIWALSYDLESEMPDGPWFADITAYRPTTG